MTRTEARTLCDSFLTGKYSDQEGADILIELAQKGETPEEIAGFSDSLIANAMPFPNRAEVFDLCGTGGSKVDRFNVSTTVTFILSAAGVSVAKHGNKGSKKPNGSFDLLEELGIPIELDGEQLSVLLNELNLAFIYARKFHSAMKNVVKARKIANRRTIFNLAGPVSNPANVTSQLIGTVNAEDIDRLTKVMQLLNRNKAMVISGYPMIDEVSVSGESIIAELIDGHVNTLELTPEKVGLKRIEYSDIPCGLCDVNAMEFMNLIEGQGNPGIESMVVLNAGISFYSLGMNSNLLECIREAKKIIQTGKLKEQFQNYRQRAKSLMGIRN